MSKLANYFLKKYYANQLHPYRNFEARVQSLLSKDSVLLDAGCGRTAPVLQKYLGKAGKLIGVDLVDFIEPLPGLTLRKADLSHIPVADSSVDIVMSRSVFEHLDDPLAVYQEVFRILKPGGRVVFLTANAWDYATIIARIIPNRFHPAIVARVEGRDESDVFPTRYRTNSFRSVKKLALATGFTLENFEYLSQYPNYLMFSGVLFFLGMCYEKLIAHFKTLNFLKGWILVVLRKPV
jgi:ubiquinone/menaquinone biosynthesis C-methylase UbiE